MKSYIIQRKTDKVCGHISQQHFGYDSQVRRIRWHGIYSADNLLIGNWQEDLEELDREHRWCIRFPWPAKFRKDMYEFKKND